MRRPLSFVIFVLLAVVLAFPVGVTRAQGDPAYDAAVAANAQLRAMGVNMQIAVIHFFTIGGGRSSTRILQQDTRWVPGDPNRQASGNDLTYVIDESQGNTSSGLSSADTSAAIERAMATWDRDSCMSGLSLVRRPDGGDDYAIFDSFFGFGGYGNYLYADIVNAGWYPSAYFEAVGGPGGGTAFWRSR